MGSVPRGAHTIPSTAEVAIIGGGTAGLFAAYLLAQQGVDVQLLEASEHLGPPARTFIITNRLSDVLGFVPTGAILNRTPLLQLVSPRRSATIRLHEPDLIVERQALIEALAAKAAAAGADIRLGRRFVGLEADRDGLTLHLEHSSNGRHERVRTRNLVGADGAHSRVASAAGLGGFGTVSLLQARVALPPWARPDTTQVWFDPQSTPFFYWLEPESSASGIVGLIADGAHQAQQGLHSFLAYHGLASVAYQAAEVPFYRPRATLWRMLEGGRAFLIGDAAGQVKMTTVGGIVTGLRGAQAIAQAIVRGSSYSRELAALHRELTLHLLVHRTARRLGPADYDDLVGFVDPRVERIMATHTRDEIARILFPSLLAQPRFLLLAAGRLLLPFRPSPHPRKEQPEARPLSRADNRLP